MSDNVVITSAIKVLQELTQSASTNKDEYITQLNNLKAICDKSLAQRVAVGNANAYDAILNVMILFKNDVDMIKICLKSMISLQTGNPDLLNSAGIELMMGYFDKQKDEEIIQLVLKWVKECCTKHENNR